MKKLIILSIQFLLLFGLTPQTLSAKEPYWEKYDIDLSGLSEQQVQVLESTISQLRALEADDLKINKKVYRRLSRFQ